MKRQDNSKRTEQIIKEVKARLQTFKDNQDKQIWAVVNFITHNFEPNDNWKRFER